MTTPPSSPSTYPSPLTDAASHSPLTLKRTRKATHLRSLATRPVGAERPLAHVDPTTGKANGIVARDKVNVTYENWKQVPATQKDFIRDDIQAEFDIPEAYDLRTKKKILQNFKSDWTSKWALAADKDSVDDIDVRKKAQAIQKQNSAPHMLSRGDYEFLKNKLMEEKKKKQLEETAKSGSTDTIIDPPSPIRRHVKWKMTRTKKTGQMTSEAAKEIADQIDVLTAAIGRPEHPCRVRAIGASVTIKQYFGPNPRTSRMSLSMPLKDLEQLTQKIRDQLEKSIIEKPEVGPSATRVSTKETCVDPSENDPDTGDSEKCGLYVEENPPRLVAIGRLYEGSTTIHNIPLRHDQVKVGIEEVTNADAHIPVPSEEVQLVGQTLNTFLAWPTHLVKCLSEQVKWDATVFGVFNENFPLYIKHEDLSEIAHGGQCLNISIIQLWIMHMNETSMRAGNADVYGFLEPQSIQRSGQSQFESEMHIGKWSSFCLRKMLSSGFVRCIIGQTTTSKELLTGLDDIPQSKFKAVARWIAVKYFNDTRLLEPERLKAFRIQ
ncbi:hypothetical protein HKD37_14G040361 [Glycine soja]